MNRTHETQRFLRTGAVMFERRRGRGKARIPPASDGILPDQGRSVPALAEDLLNQGLPKAEVWGRLTGIGSPLRCAEELAFRGMSIWDLLDLGAQDVLEQSDAREVEALSVRLGIHPASWALALETPAAQRAALVSLGIGLPEALTAALKLPPLQAGPWPEALVLRKKIHFLQTELPRQFPGGWRVQEFISFWQVSGLETFAKPCPETAHLAVGQCPDFRGWHSKEDFFRGEWLTLTGCPSLEALPNFEVDHLLIQNAPRLGGLPETWDCREHFWVEGTLPDLQTLELRTTPDVDVAGLPALERITWRDSSSCPTPYRNSFISVAACPRFEELGALPGFVLGITVRDCQRFQHLPVPLDTCVLRLANLPNLAQRPVLIYPTTVSIQNCQCLEDTEGFLRMEPTTDSASSLRSMESTR